MKITSIGWLAGGHLYRVEYHTSMLRGAKDPANERAGWVVSQLIPEGWNIVTHLKVHRTARALLKKAGTTRCRIFGEGR